MEVASFIIMASTHTFPNYHIPLIILSTMFIGFSQGSVFLPFMIAFKNLNGGEHPARMNIWMSLSS